MIREARIERGLTQEQLGLELGVGQSAVSSWERGLACPDRPTIFVRLHQLFDLNIETLVRAADELARA